MDTRLLRQTGFGVEVKFKFDPATGMSMRWNEPDAEQLDSFLIRFRPFVSQGEDVYLQNIHNLCFRAAKADELKRELQFAREHYSKVLKGLVVKIQFNGTAITPEHLSDLWINGIYFHNDEKKRAELEAMHPALRSLARTEFLSLLVDGARQVMFLRGVIVRSLADNLFDFDGVR